MSDLHPEATRALLWSCIEDYCGLWNLVWELNSLYAERHIAPPQSLAMAQRIALMFVNEGLVQVFRCTWGDSDYKSVTSIDIESLLSDPRNWDPPAVGDKYFALSATEKGERIYRKMAP